MKIGIIGASGGVGRHVLRQALEGGHEVQALVRDPAKLELSGGFEVIHGDATIQHTVNTLVEGNDVVISCVGNAKNHFIMEKAAQAILTAARNQKKTPKCLFISAIGCGGTSWLVKLVFTIIGGRKSLADYEKADGLISSEMLVPVVLVRPSGLQDRPGTGEYRPFTGDGTFARPISRADVAQFLMDAASSSKWDGNQGIQLAGC